MEKKQRGELNKREFVQVEKYFEDFFPKDQKSADGFRLEKTGAFFAAMRTYGELSEKFHCPGGDGYYIAQRCLTKYLDYKFLCANRQFRFAFTEDTIGKKEVDFERERFSNREEEMQGTRADIYYLLFEADRNSAASRCLKSYTESSKPQLTAVLISIIEAIVDAMEHDSDSRFKAHGKLLRVSYMEEIYENMQAAELYEVLGYSKKKYYTVRRQAISVLSQFLFGFFAGESGLAQLYTDGTEIIIPYLKKNEER